MPGSVLVGRNAQAIKAHNQRTLLIALLRQQPIARVRLARTTGISTTTVTNLVAEFARKGVICETGVDADAPRSGVGRPPIGLSICPASRFALGIYLAPRCAQVALADLQANILDFESIDIAPDLPVERCVALATAASHAIVERSLDVQTRACIVGAGVGSSGIVEHTSGVNVFAPSLGWSQAPLRDLFAGALGLPVAVDNSVRCMALAESLFGMGRNAGALAFVFARAGVGAGLVVDGEVYRGADSGAGEIGHWATTTQDGVLCSCGNRGCLETLISERALFDRAEGVHPGLTQGRNIPLQVLFDAARDGHLALVELLEERAYHVGLALANLVNLFNPQVIMVGGWLYDAFDLIEPVMERTMRLRAFGGLGEQVRILPTSFGSHSGVIGAASLAFETFFLTQA